ncbi:MAG: insulinase family protein [Magnetococcales bacterium]|nr:insulinase family protein [Magnetococcales bacterium]
MKRRPGSWKAGVWLWGAALLWSGGGEAASWEARDFTLDNGMRVILVREPKAPVAVFQVWYKVGAMEEASGKTGLAHMLEHMMFRGTEEIGPGEYNKIVAREGAEENAVTAHDFTMYFLKLASDRLELAFRLEADRMRNLLLDPREFRSENDVVREERRQRIDSNPSARLYEEFYSAAFSRHPYGRPVIGWMSDLQELTVGDLRDWYDRWYAPNNAVLVVVGDVEFAQGEELARRYFGPLPRNPALDHPPIAAEPEQGAERRLEIRDKKAKTPSWLAAWKAPSVADPSALEDIAALDVMVTILGDGSISRLSRSLVEESKTAVGVGASYGGVGRDRGLLMLSATPKDEAAIPEVEKRIFAEVALMAREPVDEGELQRAKNQIIAAQIFLRDSVHQIGWIIGHVTLSGADWRLLERYDDHIRAVTPEQVRQVAQRYLPPHGVTVGVMRPGAEAGKGEATKAEDVAKSDAPTKTETPTPAASLDKREATP